MTDTDRFAAEIRSVFESYGFPQDFLDIYDQLECLAYHRGRETFLVRNKETGKLCVAKCYLKSDYTFSDTKDILSKLDHTGVPHYEGRFESEAMVCVVREYIEGTPLDEYSGERSLSYFEVTDICIKLAEILAYLHGQEPPVIHRDIKPENVIIRTDGSLCLIDFDIARTFKESEEYDTVFFGTKGYAPPEQYGFSQTDKRSDIYSFGVLLRFLLTNSVRANDKIRIYRPLQKIIDKCTAFAPEKRYSDMGEVIKDLKQADPVSQRWRFAKAALCCVIIALAVGAAGKAIYDKVTYDPFNADAIPAFVSDEERVADAVTYMNEKYNTEIFNGTTGTLFDAKGSDAVATIGLLKTILIDVYGLDPDYVNAPNTDMPQESEDYFLPWTWADEQTVSRNVMVYAAVKVQDPALVADWSVLKDDNGEYPGERIALEFAEKTGIMTGANRPDDITVGEMALILANTERVFAAAGSAEAGGK